jgi:integrase/recombinase XerD
MGQAAADYLALRRALGTRLQQPGQLLRDFAAGLDARRITRLTVAEALAWAAAPAGTSPYWHGWRLGVLRGWSRYLHSLDPVHEVIPDDLIPGTYPRRTPFVFTGAEIAALMEAAARLRYALTAATFHTLLGLLATTGIRPGEAFGLDRDSVGLEAGVLTVVSTKTSQVRRLGMHDTTITALTGYARRRDLLCPHPAQPYFLLSVRGTRLNATIADRTFRGLARAAGVTARPDGTRPLLRSFRHTFAVTTILSWYRDGTDVDAAMPALSAWLGHSNPRDTYWYISATPELLALAVEKMTSTASQSPAS